LDNHAERRRNRTGHPELQDTRTQRIVLRLMRGTATRNTAELGAGAVLRRPDFRWLLAGTTLSNGAQWI
jgi:hypothetical protein